MPKRALKCRNCEIAMITETHPILGTISYCKICKRIIYPNQGFASSADLQPEVQIKSFIEASVEMLTICHSKFEILPTGEFLPEKILWNEVLEYRCLLCNEICDLPEEIISHVKLMHIEKVGIIK